MNCKVVRHETPMLFLFLFFIAGLIGKRQFTVAAYKTHGLNACTRALARVCGSFAFFVTSVGFEA